MRTIELTGAVGDESFSVRQVTDLPPGPVKIIIDSLGGCVVTGLSIFQLLLDHPGHVTTEVLHAGSAAVLPGLAGQTRLIRGGGWIFIHECWGSSVGRAADMFESARVMKAQNRLSAGLISERTGRTLRCIQRLARNETTLDASQSLKLGFATEILGRPRTVERSFNAAKTGLAMLRHQERMQEPEPCRLFDEARPVALTVPGASAVLDQPAKPLPKIAPEKSGEVLCAFVENQRRQTEIYHYLARRLQQAINRDGQVCFPIHCVWTCGNCKQINHGPPGKNWLASSCCTCGATTKEN